MLKSLIELRRDARGEKFKQFFFSLLITKTASWSQTFLVEMLETGVENREPTSVPKTSPRAPGVVRLFLNAGYFFSMGRQITSPIWSPPLHANKPIKGRRYESFKLVTCQTTCNCVTLILTSRFWHDRSSCHAFTACRRKQTGECWCTSP